MREVIKPAAADAHAALPKQNKDPQQHTQNLHPKMIDGERGWVRVWVDTPSMLILRWHTPAWTRLLKCSCPPSPLGFPAPLGTDRFLLCGHCSGAPYVPPEIASWMHGFRLLACRGTRHFLINI